MQYAVCTIIAKNYLAFARTLAQSFHSFHPDYKVYVLIVDDFETVIAPDECFEIIKLTDLNIPDLPALCFKYDVKELCTAVKARLLEYLLHEKPITRVMYLDPDILVTGPLTQLFEKLSTFDIILTPHLDTDYPADGLLPDDGYILRAGQFNLGFIAINSSENGQTFLNWWKQKLDENCVIDLVKGYFVDQKFIDFVPILFKNCWIERDPGYNVAYWNLHSRRLSRSNGVWKCNDGPLYFFHFSGYSADGPGISSHIPTSLARHLLSNRPDLKELFEMYRGILLENGYKQTTNWPYTFACFNSGEPIPAHVRRFYRELGARRNALGDPFASMELKSLAARGDDPNSSAETAAEQLNAILNSRAWRWVSRYGRLKDRLFQGFVSRRAVIQKDSNASICFCTLAIHEAYRQRAQRLCAGAPAVPWIVLTDEPDDFANLPVRAIRHEPTGPMAVDLVARLPHTGDGHGTAAYHDKRFALRAALEDFDTAIYVDADSRITEKPSLVTFPGGIAVLPVVEKSIAEHLSDCGSWRMPLFMDLARELTGDTRILHEARWCHEGLIAVTKDGRESRFFEAWAAGANFFQSRDVHSGEGGVIGLAAYLAGWNVDYQALSSLGAAIQHEGGGPKKV
jgi:lipopolysaccharide biosynthesis glycosyltransferase